MLKPSELSPLTALELAAIAHTVGLPGGVLNVLPGDGPHTGTTTPALKFPFEASVSIDATLRRVLFRRSPGRTHRSRQGLIYGERCYRLPHLGGCRAGHQKGRRGEGALELTADVIITARTTSLCRCPWSWEAKAQCSFSRTQTWMPPLSGSCLASSSTRDKCAPPPVRSTTPPYLYIYFLFFYIC